MDRVPLNTKEVAQDCSDNKDQNWQKSLLIVGQRIQADQDVSDEPIIHDDSLHLWVVGTKDFH